MEIENRYDSKEIATFIDETKTTHTMAGDHFYWNRPDHHYLLRYHPFHVISESEPILIPARAAIRIYSILLQLILNHRIIFNFRKRPMLSPIRNTMQAER